MPQLHLYVPEGLAREVKRRAASRGLSVSAFLSDLVQRAVADEWPEDFFESIVGGWRGEPLERPEQLPLQSRADLRGEPEGT